jgi:predicted nucleotidyltransferase
MGIKSTSLADALFSKAQQRVLGLLFTDPARSFYTNEIVRHAAIGVGAVQRELEKLEGCGLVSGNKIGNQKHYQANAKAPIFTELRGILLKTSGLADILRAALTPLAGQIQVAFVYGSVARGVDTAHSDIDLMLIGDKLVYADVYAILAQAEQQLGRPVNPSIVSMAELQQKLADGNGFLTQVLTAPKIFLIASENELPTLGQAV